MQLSDLIYGFMDAVSDDPRISPAHISLYLAILHFYRKQDWQNPVCVFARELMQQAKIGSSRTYHACLKDLKEGGYIKYVPSYNPFLGSLVYLKDI